MDYKLEIVGCPIVREEDGLALSSRNKRLSARERENALNISQTLFKSRTFAASHTVSETQKMVEEADRGCLRDCVWSILKSLTETRCKR